MINLPPVADDAEKKIVQQARCARRPARYSRALLSRAALARYSHFQICTDQLPPRAPDLLLRIPAS